MVGFATSHLSSQFQSVSHRTRAENGQMLENGVIPSPSEFGPLGNCLSQTLCCNFEFWTTFLGKCFVNFASKPRVVKSLKLGDFHIVVRLIHRPTTTEHQNNV